MKLSFWSDEDRFFVQRRIGFGWNINFKFIAKKLGLVKALPQPVAEEELSKSQSSPQTRQDHLREQIEASKYEERTH
jgi:hypothetical protein